MAGWTIPWATVLVLGMACAADGGPRWTRPGSTQAEYDHDHAECSARATAIADPGSPYPGDRALIADAFEECMRGRGWSRTEP